MTKKGIELSLAEEVPKGKDKRRAEAKSAEPKGRGQRSLSEMLKLPPK